MTQHRDREARQRAILTFLATERDYPPTVREIGNAVGLSSPSSVFYHLLDLEQRGLIRSTPGRARTWRLA